ncbi:hypothetical protein Bca4012_072802 [Brassica carinata]|nr:unnamed protein product [Brassica napus]
MSAPREMQSCCRRWHSAIRREEESKVTGAGVLCQRHHHHRSSTHRLVVGEPYFSLVTLHSGVENCLVVLSLFLFGMVVVGEIEIHGGTLVFLVIKSSDPF